MSWLVIALILLFGLLLLTVEVFFVPGTTFVGIIGLVLVIAGVVCAYSYRGVFAGNVTLVVSGVASIALLIYGFRTISSGRFGLKESVSSRVNTSQVDAIEVGDEGTTFTYLRPNGKAMINGQKVEVYSLGEYTESNRKVKVVKTDNHKIYVKPVD